MKTHNLIMPCLLSVVLYSCSDQDELQVKSEMNRHVYFTVDSFIPEAQTRTDCDPNNNYKITWASGDAIGIFPREGDQEPFVIPADQVGQSKAAFDGGYWALKDGKTYNAYYPFSRENYASADMKTQIPVSYLGQYQNGRECNVGAFDYTYSDWNTSIGGASVSFSFHHIGSFLVLHLPIQETATYTSLELKASGNVIPTTGTYDLTATKPTFVAKTTATSLSMTLNYEVSQGEMATFYMMLPPVDLSGETITVSLSAGASVYDYSIESKNILPAKLYDLTGTFSAEVEHEYVDLGIVYDGIPVYWAKTNIGAEKPADFGDYYAWGETEPKTSYSENNYKYYQYFEAEPDEEDADGFIIPGKPAGWRYVDIGEDISGSNYDVAHVKWGGNWRMPRKWELSSLAYNCTWTWVQMRNSAGDLVSGYKVSNKTDSSKFIFLPAAGCYRGSDFDGRYGNYWTSCVYQDEEFEAMSFYGAEALDVKYSIFQCPRYEGRSIRPVYSVTE